MSPRPVLGLVAAVLIAAGGSGCGVGPGDPVREDVSLLVTDSFGRRTVGAAGPENPPKGDTVMRFLQRHFDVKTRYSGGFVQSINGRSGGNASGRPVDWFYYVNGVEAPRGAASTRLAGGGSIWWDRHDWGGAMRVPAVVGAYPEPFASGVDGERRPVRVDCAAEAEPACDEVSRRLEGAGIRSARAGLGAPAGIEVLRLLVGPWRSVRRDTAARQLEEGPGVSGVFARPDAGGVRFELLDEKGRPARTLRGSAGLVAATRFRDQQPTWVVTGTDTAGVRAAALALSPRALRRRFAIVLANGRSRPLPVAAR